ncbi:MAG: hypothetical protein IJL71_00005, partial [Oscillospiraceae bacterium]|nr:hypothetical protein [Oscillospiraceae bacterium]
GKKQSVAALFNRDTETSIMAELPKGFRKIVFTTGEKPVIKSGYVTLPPLTGMVLVKSKVKD